MKNTLLTAILSCFLFSQLSFAQASSDVIPADPSVKTGVLTNGIKYSIKKNTKPEKRCELRLAINAGSMLETDEQQGLAHFVEHMCFNGTKNFKKSALIDYPNVVKQVTGTLRRLPDFPANKQVLLRPYKSFSVLQ